MKRCWRERSDTAAAAGGPAAGGDQGEPEHRPGPPSSVHVTLQRGPDILGRNVVVDEGQASPAEWNAAPRVRVDDATLADPASAIAELRAARGAVIELASREFDVGRPPPSTEQRAPWELGPGFEFPLDELHELVWRNAIDARAEPRWPAVDAAVGLGASVCGAGEPGDVRLPDGTAVWIDGGPIGHRDPIDGVPVLHAVQLEHGRLALADENVTEADLAPDQRAAVVHTGASARIIAPAGSGKTRVLTERARHLVQRWNLPAGAVTLVAFNKRAQQEMSSRTADLVGLQVRTLNSIALAIVNGTPPFAPQGRTWRTIDEPDVRRLLQRFVSTPRRRNTDPLAPWIDALSLVRLGLVDPVEVEARYGGDVDGLADVLPHYLAALERDGAVDFDGQIDRAIRVLLTDPHARREARGRCRMLLVDEFQDLTPAHLFLVRLLAGPTGGVFGVGDDDQTIYGYNGADPGWLIDFERWFPGAGDHPLVVNYRCPAGTVEVADRLVRHNRRRVTKTIRAADGAPDGGWLAVDGDDPVAATVGAVEQALAAGASPSDVAVLTRVNAVIAPVQVALVQAGVPFTGGVGSEFTDRTAVRAALAWLRLASGSFRADDVGEALRRPSRPLHPRIADWAGEQRDVAGLRRLAERLTNERDADRIGSFADDVERLGHLVASADGGRVMNVLLDEIGLGRAVATLDATRRGMNRAAQGDDLVALRQLARLHDAAGAGIDGFERWLHEGLRRRRDDRGAVLATVHRVKGQEWPFVVVHLADDEQFPHRLADDPEEERRLFHVAITRASRHVTVVSGERPSPFVAELTAEPPDPAAAPPVAAPRPLRERPASAAVDRPEHPLLDRSRVMAVAGIVLVDQGHDWVITALEPEAAVAERDGATRRFPIGAKVETAGRQRGRLGPRPGDVDEASARLFDLLRSYRDRARAGKPAYTVFDDKTLAAIADALPGDLDDLARVRGVGPAKLEQYGDDVLELVVEAVDP